MPRLPLAGRRIHIAGSISVDPEIAAKTDVETARQLVGDLVKTLIKRGANFVVPIDVDKRRQADSMPVCFDWLVWQTLHANLDQRPADIPGPLAIAVQHYKTEDQIPKDQAELWDRLRDGPLVEIENAAQWNMNSKRMEIQARSGDILITLGGGEGVLYLANLYHAVGKPVIPLDLPLTADHEGARQLYRFGLQPAQAERLFRTNDGQNSHAWLNRIRFPARQKVDERVNQLIDLLEALESPCAFAVRLLNDKHPDFRRVEDHFETVVRPIIEGELGYRLVVIDGEQAFDYPRVDQEIFEKLHRSRVVLADITGGRPNCFLELGYAFGRALPTMVMGRAGTDLPFDITTFSGLLWDDSLSLKERRDAFRTHWQAIRNRPPLVSPEPLI